MEVRRSFQCDSISILLLTQFRCHSYTCQECSNHNGVLSGEWILSFCSGLPCASQSFKSNLRHLTGKNLKTTSSASAYMTLHVIAGTEATLTLPCTYLHVFMCKRNLSNHRPVALFLRPMDLGAPVGPRLCPSPAMEGMSVHKMLRRKLWLLENFELSPRCSHASYGRQHVARPGIILCEGIVPFSHSLPSPGHLAIH